MDSTSEVVISSDRGLWGLKELLRMKDLVSCICGRPRGNRGTHQGAIIDF
jgi:hypothetical protein